MTIALLGTGLLGYAVAERLHQTGEQVVVYNRTAHKTDGLRRLGVSVASTAGRALVEAEATLLLLADAAAIRAVLFDGEAAAAIQGRTIIQMGTIGPDESRALQHDVEQRGGRYLEAPVLGSKTEAKDGTLLVMVGAAPEQAAAWAPLLRRLGEVHLVGSVGSAAALKLALNHFIAAETAAFSLSLGLVRHAGVSVDTFMSLVRPSALYAPTFDKKLPRLAARRYDAPNFSTRHLLKDVNLVIEAAQKAGLAVDGIAGVRAVLNETMARGLDDVDYSAMYETIDPAEKD